MWTWWSPTKEQKRCLDVHFVKVCRNSSLDSGTLTIFYEDFQTLFKGQSRVKDDEPETDWEDIITCAEFEQVSYGALVRRRRSSVTRAHNTMRAGTVRSPLGTETIRKSKEMAYQSQSFVPVHRSLGLYEGLRTRKSSRTEV
jgi:hypothetical protein